MSLWTSTLAFAVLVIAGGCGWHNGYHMGVTNVPQKALIEWVLRVRQQGVGSTASETQLLALWSLMPATYSLGAIVGSVFTAFFADRCGRKRGLMWSIFISMTGSIVLVTMRNADCFEGFLFGRFLVGVSAGLNTGLSQIYLVEIAPTGIRGGVGSVVHLAKAVGFTVAQLKGLLLTSEQNWSYFFITPMVPAVLQMIALPFCAESPIYLLVYKENEPETEQALRWLRRKDNVKEELDEIVQDDNLIRELRLVTFKRMFTNHSLKVSLVVCSVLMVGQHLTGIGILIFHATKTFKMMGTSDSVATTMTISLGIFATLVSVYSILVIDFFGRRKLLLFSYFSMALSTAGCTLLPALMAREKCTEGCAYGVFFFLVMMMGGFIPGIGCIMGFYSAELFHHTARSLGVCISVTVMRVAEAVVGGLYIFLVQTVNYYLYPAFIILDVFFFIYTYMHVPETSRLSFGEIIKFYQ